MGRSAAVWLSKLGRPLIAVFGGEACARCVERAYSLVLERNRSGDWIVRFTAEGTGRA